MTDRDDALCFDMYGTLCETGSVTRTLRAELGISAGFAAAVDELWRHKQLQYSYQRGQMGEYAPFSTVTADALSYALAYYDIDPGTEVRERMLAAYDHLDAFPDAVESLAGLREAGYGCWVLSNGDPEMLETLSENAGLTPHLDGLVSADEVRTFKPAPAVYENAADRLDRQIGECRLVSSNAWDVAGAANAGMATAWVNRNGEPAERVGGDADIEVDSLAALAERLG
ncbi:haloacid dehalogenase type II [Natronorarus salvus]|uniref:haloacid dehalogenase type II n=1 Tax=Natronorarus salvus TaxID=3117733 RepID=UPI002F2699CD